MKITLTQVKNFEAEAFLTSASDFFKGYQVQMQPSVFDVRKDHLRRLSDIASSRFQIRSEQGIMTFMVTCAVLGVDFWETHPEFGSVLNSKRIGEKKKVSELARITMDILNPKR